MKKKREQVSIRGRNRLQKMLMVMKLTFFLTMFMVGSLHASVNAQLRLTMNLGEANLKEVFDEIQRQTSKTVIYNNERLDLGRMIKADFNDMELDAVLEEVLSGSGMGYKLVNDYIVIVPQKEEKENFTSQTVKEKTIKGVVKDEEGSLLPGVTVLIKGTTIGTATDVNGAFSLNIPDMKDIVLLFSFVGMKTQEINVKGKTTVDVVMEEEQTEMDEVVVTGIYTRKKESFTGSSQTYKAEDLKMVGNQNILQSLRTLDPSFVILEDNQWGSDPNRVPDVEIRGKTSIIGFKEEFGQDPNQPLFILDGFETTLETIMDLSLDRVASVTILKDAASTAIYGSKAANGVVVVETKAPAKGKMRLSYNGNYDISFADLTDYNLMNAREKLEFERLAGNFDADMAGAQEQMNERYYDLLEQVERGVDTYWLSEPLRVAFNHRHNLYTEGGDDQMRYGLGVGYSSVDGVMKNSIRNILSVNLDLLYRKNKVSFQNKLSIDYTKTENPVVAFSEYSRANPYYEKRTPGGGVERWLEAREYVNSVGVSYQSFWVENPLYNASLSSYNKGNSFAVRDNFSFEYSPTAYLRFRARIGVSKTDDETEVFTAPEDTRYDETTILRKGSYSDTRSDNWSYNGEFSVTYGQLLKEKHQLNLVGGISLNENNSSSKGFSGEGFPEGGFSSPGFINSYTEGEKPSYSEDKSRDVSFYLNGGYSFDNRYMIDINLRSDGTSIFGVNKRFSTTWSVGLAWNLHNEKFIKDRTSLFNMFKIRGSVGNPGNQSYGSFTSITVYEFDNWLLNNFGTGLVVSSFGDPDMDWQRTINVTVGLDLSLYENRLHFTADYYYKNTDPLMAYIGVASSVGVTSRMANVGKSVERGFDGMLRYSFLYKPKERINWTTSLSFRTGKGYYDKVGEALDAFNQQNMGSSLDRYYDGGSPTALWAVRSGGIETTTCREIFITKNGEYTYDHSYDGEVVVGDTRPKIEGVFGNVLYYKGLNVSVQFRYSLGSQSFNSTLWEKVENITEAGLSQNQDRRALYDRWQKPGDYAKFKGITLTESTPISSRFVMDNDYLKLESVRIGYEFKREWLQHIGISGMTIDAYMSDIWRISTIKQERGIDYPFARTISFSLGINL